MKETQEPVGGIHELKIWPEYFDDVESGKKNFEVRKLDRLFGVGDILHLREWSLIKGYSGRETRKVITYVMAGGQWGLSEGNCILGIATPPPAPVGIDVEAMAKEHACNVIEMGWRVNPNKEDILTDFKTGYAAALLQLKPKDSASLPQSSTEEEKELIEKLKYVDHVLSDDGYQSESEIRSIVKDAIDYIKTESFTDSKAWRDMIIEYETIRKMEENTLEWNIGILQETYKISKR